MSHGSMPEFLSCHRGTPGLEQHHRHKQPEPSTHWGCPPMAGPRLALLRQNGLGDHDCPCSGSSPWQGGHCGRAEPNSPRVTGVGKLGAEGAALLPHCTKGVPGRHLAVVFLKPSSITSPCHYFLPLSSGRFFPQCLSLGTLCPVKVQTEDTWQPSSLQLSAGPAIILYHLCPSSSFSFFNERIAKSLAFFHISLSVPITFCSIPIPGGVSWTVFPKKALKYLL